MEATAIFVLLATSLLVAGVIVFERRRRAEETGDERRSRQERLSFHAVAVKPGAGACQAARQLKGVRFLGENAPQFPLPGCNAAECTCVYVHFDDRRFHNRRDVYMNKAYMIADEAVERRDGRGRRSTDAMVVHPTV